MPDGFEVLNFCLNVLVSDGAFDPDGDAVQNINELGQLTLPCDPIQTTTDSSTSSPCCMTL